MIIIVDAYNVLKQITRDTWVSEPERVRFIKQLAKYAKKRGHKLIVVFDGGTDKNFVQEYKCGICVVYSGISESADEYIKRLVQRHKNYDLLLVSSDSDLAAWADQHAIESIDSSEFYKIVCYTIKKHDGGKKKLGSTTTKITHDENAELDTLMYEENEYGFEKIEEEDQKRSRSGHQVSKQEKKMVKKIKKL